MNFLRRVDKEGNKRLVPNSPQRPQNPRYQVKRNKNLSAIPDLVGDKDSETSSDYSISPRDIMDIDTKLLRAKERRDQSERNREMDLNIRNERQERALCRAKETLLQKQAKIRYSTFKIAKANEERCLQEEKRRNDTMEMCQNKLSEAVSRAEQNLKRKQIKAKHCARTERVQQKRALLDFERKAAILATEDHRKEKATSNRLCNIKNRQYKAREEIEHAQLVAKRMKAVRILQRITRDKFGMESGPVHSPLCSENDAATRLQNWTLWRERVVVRRLSESSSNLLRSVLYNVGGDCANGTRHSFETLTAEITTSNNLESARQLLTMFRPLLKTFRFRKQNNQVFISDRVLLLAFLISVHPDEVLGDKRHSDKCSARLEASCNALIRSLHCLVDNPNTEISVRRKLIRNVTQSILAYGTLFDLWKSADLMELVSDMVTSIEQSWIVYLTSKKALSYRSEEGNVPEEEAFFQHRLWYETSKREAGSHIRRVRASIIKVLGMKEGAEVLKDAKASAISRIKRESLMDNIRGEVDDIISKRDKCVSLKEKNEADVKKSNIENIESQNKSLFSNARAVHDILLTDDDDVDAVSEFSFFDGMDQLEEVEDVEMFFNTLKGCIENKESSVELMVAKTMERAFLDKVSIAWLQNNSKTVKQLMVELCAKLRNLIPSRVDLHSLIQDSHIQSCSTPAETLCLVQKIANILCYSLEAPIRSHSTSEWIQKSNISPSSPIIPFGFGNIETFVVASIIFFMKKADLCAIDVMKFDMLKAAPIIRQYGHDYELKEFENSFGALSSMKSTKHLHATWTWLSRVRFNSTEHFVGKIEGEGFVDNLLFTQDATEMPEVLYLDAGKIDSIRKVAQKSVLCSALILRACSQVGASSKPSSLSSDAIFHKENLLSCLKDGNSFDSLWGEVSETIVWFAEAISGEQMEESQVESLKNSALSILKGNDPVLKLMDNRIRQLFRVASAYSEDKEKVPSSMRSGISNNFGRNANTKISKKEKFMVELSKVAEKLGFGFVCEELLQATYVGHKIIKHCIAVYGKQILNPMISEIRASE